MMSESEEIGFLPMSEKEYGEYQKYQLAFRYNFNARMEIELKKLEIRGMKEIVKAFKKPVI